MSNENIDNQTDELMGQVDSASSKATDAVKGVAKEAAKKAAVEAMKKAVKSAAASAIKTSLISLAAWFGVPFVIAVLVVVMIYGTSVQNKQYSNMVDTNTVESDSVENYDGSEYQNGNGRSVLRNGSSLNSSSGRTVYNRVVLNEGNQAIENYHYYNSSKSVLDNKVYIPVKGIDIEKKSTEMYNQLIKKGVIKEEGVEKFIGKDSLSEVEEEWKSQYGSIGGSFSWSDSKLKSKLDKKINTGITISGFDEKNIGALEKVDKEEDKLEIKDEYGREEYFQLPEELLGSLNKTMYNDEFIYDKPFVQGVKYTYRKEEEAKSDVSNQTVNKESADNKSYSADLFDKEFAKQNGVLRGKGQKFIDYANKYDVDAGLVVTIAVIESGRGTSAQAREKNNVFGMKNPGKQTYRTFSSVDEGIEAGIKNISTGYISQGIIDLETMGKKYYGPEGDGWKKWAADIGKQYKVITGKEYNGKGSGKGNGSNLSAFRGVPEYDIKLDSYGIGKTVQSQKYGLGTVFLYKPTIELQLKRGYSLEQTLSSSVGEKKQVGKEQVVEYNGKKNPNQTQEIIGEDGKKVKRITEYEVKEVDDGKGGKKKTQVKRVYEQSVNYAANATATPIEEVDAKVTYVLDKAITFAGVYEFEYGLVSEDVGGETSSSEREIEGAVDGNGNPMKEISKTESRTIKLYEKPIGVKNEDLSTRYMDQYLTNFKASVPKHIMNNFDINKLVKSFKGEKKIEQSTTVIDGEGLTGNADYDRVEKLRPTAEEVGAEYGIDPNLLLAMVYNESKGDHHIKGKYYWGLAQMGGPTAPQGHDVYTYFDKSEVKLTSDPQTDDRMPHCPPGGHNQAEHERVEKLHFTYMARRLTNQMYGFVKSKYNKDAHKVQITPNEIKNAALYTFCAYNTGAGGQNSIRSASGFNDDLLYSAPGTTYTKYHAMADSSRGGDLNTKANGRYLEKGYKDYALFTGGYGIDKTAELYQYDPSKWFSSGRVSVGGTDSGMTIGVSSNGSYMDAEKIKLYMDYEDGVSIGEKLKIRTVNSNMSYGESELIRKSAIGMIEGKAAYDVETEEGAFWGKGYVENYFDAGLPSRPLLGDELGESIWNGKIKESSQYTGDRESILGLSRMYGREVYDVIKRAVAQENKFYENGAAGPNSFDQAGLLWYVFNYNSKVKYFEKDTFAGYYEKIKTEVPSGDIRPGDVIFYKKKGVDKSKPDKVGIYLGQKAYLYIDEKEGMVTIGEYENLKNNTEYEIVAERRVLKYSAGANGDITMSGVGQLPPDLVKGDWANPLGDFKYRQSSGFGMRIHPITGKRSFHTGTDIPTPVGTKVYSSKEGTVIVSKRSPDVTGSYGNYIVVRHDGYTTLYAHLSERFVNVGDVVNKGQLIGAAGNTGGSTGPHLHFEMVKGIPGHFGGIKATIPEGNYIDPSTIFPPPIK